MNENPNENIMEESDDDYDDDDDDYELKKKIDEIDLTYVYNQNELLGPIQEIERIIAENINEKDKTTPEYIDGINKIKSILFDNCGLRYSNYVNDHEYYNENIFNVPIENGNNMLMLLCINEIDQDLCIHIIKYYGKFFELGEINEQKQTALIISIKNNMFDVAAALLDYKYDPVVYDYPNMGQLDEFGNTAMDYMLAKIKYDEDGKIKTIKNENNDIIIENIDIIAELLRFHLNELYDEPHNKVSQFYINLFCKYRDFWRPLLEEDFKNDDDDDDDNVNNFIDFKQSDNEHTNKVCDDILKAIPEYTKTDVISTIPKEPRPMAEGKRTHDEMDMPSATEIQPNQETEIRNGIVITKVPLTIDTQSTGGKKTKTKNQKRKTKTTKSKTKSKKAPRHTNQRRTVSR